MKNNKEKNKLKYLMKVNQLILIGMLLFGWIVIQPGALRYKPKQKVVGFIDFHVIPYFNKQFKLEWNFILQGIIWF